MTEKLYDIDSSIKEFSATVIDCYKQADGYVTVLDRTAFFPEGGGQGSDKGFLNETEVSDVQIKEDIIFHYTTKPFKTGEIVNGKIDFERRFDFMQQHSAEHIVSGIAHKYYGLENVGFHLGEDIVTLDFDKPLNREEILRIEALANEAVFKNVRINAYYPDEENLKNLKYRSKKEIEGAVRIVEIEGVDVCACCAPHVKKTGEIGIVKLLGSEKIRGGVRIELKAGKRALMDYNEKYLNIAKISNLLCVKQNESFTAVERLSEQINELKFELNGLKRKMLDAKLENFVPQEDFSALFLGGLAIKELQSSADFLFKKFGGIRAVLSASEDGFCFAVCGDTQPLDDWFLKFKQEFNVKGGGRNGMVQGTVLANAQELEKFWNKK